jgi:hypothetical protein
MRRLQKHVSFANVIAVIALFVALGGAAYAGSKINGKTIKNATISKKKLKANVLKGLDTCPSNAPSYTQGICYSSAQAPSSWDGANQLTCRGQGLRAPTVGEALLVMTAVGGGPGNETWTDQIAEITDTNTRVLVKAPGDPSGQIFAAPSGSSHSVRCVINATNPPS